MGLPPKLLESIPADKFLCSFPFQVNQKVMRKQLETAGHRVHLANHGGECLEFIQRSRFCQVENGLPLDVILLDLEMPVSIIKNLTLTPLPF